MYEEKNKAFKGTESNQSCGGICLPKEVKCCLHTLQPRHHISPLGADTTTRDAFLANPVGSKSYQQAFHSRQSSAGGKEFLISY